MWHHGLPACRRLSAAGTLLGALAVAGCVADFFAAPEDLGGPGQGQGADSLFVQSVTTAYDGGLEIGRGFSCAVDLGGRAFCWGSNTNGVLGSDTTGPVETAVPISSTEQYTTIAAGDGFVCALTAAGAVDCWGDNGFGALGSEEKGSFCPPLNCSEVPLRVSLPGTAVAIAAGTYHACALTDVGDAFCWGLHTALQLGSGSVGTCNDVGGPVRCTRTPVQVSGGHSFVAIAAGWLHTCAIASPELTVWCWGSNHASQLGVDTVTQQCDIGFGSLDPCTSTPTLVPGLGAVSQVSAGITHTCAVRIDGITFCWGNNRLGQLGSPVGDQSAQPAVVSVSRRFTEVRLGQGRSCALDGEGALTCWGNGIGAPTLMAAIFGEFATLRLRALGESSPFTVHRCGISVERVAYCWGINLSGQLGRGTRQFRDNPNVALPDLPPRPVLKGSG